MSTHAPTSLPSGLLIDGRYRIECELGRGGMGSVYRAQPVDGGAPVAIKVLLPRYEHVYSHRQRFVREARVASRIDHPNVTRVLGLGRDRSVGTYIVMEYLPGEDLRRRLRREGPLSWAQVRPILRQVLAGLRAAHELGVLHRDIKPSNVFLVEGREGEPDYVKLLDFGIAKAVDPASSLAEGLTRVDEVMGTVQYMAPERILGESADVRSDLFAVGVMAFRMLAGQLPRWGSNSGSDTGMRQLLRRTTEAPPSLSTLRPEVPRVLDVLVRTAMARRPDDRFSSLRALEEAMMWIPTDARRRAPALRWRATPLDVEAPTQAIAWSCPTRAPGRITLPPTVACAVA